MATMSRPIPATRDPLRPTPSRPDDQPDRMALAFIVGANLVPILGVAAFGWDVHLMILFYWFENWFVGFWTIARIVKCGGLGGIPVAIAFGFGFASVNLFYLIFIAVLIGISNEFGQGDAAAGAAEVSPLAPYLTLLTLLGLFASHGVSYVRDFVQTGAYRTAEPRAEALRPLPRLIILHITICVGGAVLAPLGMPVLLATLFVLLKLALDVAAHLVARGGKAVADAGEAGFGGASRLPVAKQTAPAAPADAGGRSVRSKGAAAPARDRTGGRRA